LEGDLVNRRSKPDPPSSEPGHLVVVRNQDGSIIRTTLQWPVAPMPVSLPSLPADLEVCEDETQECRSVDLSRAKAVFFVRSHAGNSAQHDHIRFFSNTGLVRNLWVRVRMKDGEVMEGRTANDGSLLNEPGFWLWPTDIFSNNLLIYVPKTAVAEFHIMDIETTAREESGKTYTELEEKILTN
jgi:hypothetical protein